MSGIINYGTISHEEKQKIFQQFIITLLNDRVDFNINNSRGRIEGITLTAPSIGLRALDLEMDSQLSNSNLMCHTIEHSCMINSYEQLMQEYKKLKTLNSKQVVYEPTYTKHR